MAFLSKADAAELLKENQKILALPAEEIRAGAVKQRDALVSKMDRLISSGPATQADRDRLSQVNDFLKFADGLRASEKEADRVERRRIYLRAYRLAQSTAERLDSDIKTEGIASLAITDVFAGLYLEQFKPVVDDAEAIYETGKKAVEKVADVADAIGHTAENVVYGLVAALAVAGITYAYSRGRSGSSGRGYY